MSPTVGVGLQAIPPSPEDELGKALPHLVPELEEKRRKAAGLLRDDSYDLKVALLVPQVERTLE